MIAYYPLGWHYWQNNLKNAPDWLGDTLYDIDAKVDVRDLSAWQAQGRDNTLLKDMLQSVLRDRCKLALHQSSFDGAVLKLVLEKNWQSRLTKSASDEVIPKNAVHFSLNDAWFIPSEGDLHFYKTTMKALAFFLTKPTTAPIVDGTDLPGGYDFVLPRTLQQDEAADAEPEGAVHYRLSDVGLK